MEEKSHRAALFSLPRNFWTAITMEFFERGSYYGVMSVLSVYLVLSRTEGGMGFSKESVGALKSTIVPLLYLLPILSGAIGDRFGYRKVLFFSFACMSLGYFLTGLSGTYVTVFASLMLVALGAGFFKPMITGTIARASDKYTSSLGFGVYYWSINLGAFLFPLILVPWLKAVSWHYIFYMAAIGTGWLLLLNLFLYQEPVKKGEAKPLSKVLAEMISVIADYRFIIVIIIYSGFWVMYFQQYDSVLWYLTEHINMESLNKIVNNFLFIFMEKPSWKFEAEHVTVMNAGAIIVLQLLISSAVRKWKALPTMIIGVALGSAGMALMAIAPNPWIFLTAMFVFTLGEMTAHPKFIAYVGIIAPADKKALYQGYSFLYGVIGSGIGGILGAKLYVHFVEKMHQPTLLWLTFSLIGVITVLGLLLFNRFLAKRSSH